MMRVFIVQILAAVGENYVAVMRFTQSKDLFLTLWPKLETDGHGWLFVNSEWISTLVAYVLLCLLYLALALMVRSKKMWGDEQGIK